MDNKGKSTIRIERIVLKNGAEYLEDFQYSQGMFDKATTTDPLRARNCDDDMRKTWLSSEYLKGWRAIKLVAEIVIAETPIE